MENKVLAASILLRVWPLLGPDAQGKRQVKV